MEKLKNLLKTSSVIVKLRLFREIVLEYKIVVKHLGAIKKKKSKLKWEAELLIKFHSIEKGLSLLNPRVGFGEKKIKILLNEIEEYVKVYGFSQFILNNRAVLDSYFDFNDKKGHINEMLFSKFNEVYKKYQININFNGGIKKIKKEEISVATDINFEDFFNKRYSIRDFSEVPVSIDTIKQAIEIAKKTPSACNRQSWRLYVITDDKKKENILNWQGGSNGFGESVNKLVVVCSDLNSFFINERHQPYVDGALYGMSLILALHSFGLGTIPMTLGMLHNKMNFLHKELNMPDNHVPILMIGIGNLKDEFNVAQSERVSPIEYTYII